MALAKAAVLLAVLAETGWQLDLNYYSRRYPQMPISLAWSMLAMIFFVAGAQLIGSVVLKVWSAKRTLRRASATRRMTAVIVAYLARRIGRAEVEQAARRSPRDFEASVVDVLLNLHGSSVRRVREIPAVLALRDRWIARSRSGDEVARRRAVECLSLLRDPASVAALEAAVDDHSAQVAASAVRGLLHMTSYEKREELRRSLPGRPFMVRVLTAREAGAPAQGSLAGDEARRHCAALSAKGPRGLAALRRMSASGESGDAVAEAFGAALAASARGGRS